MSVITDTAAVCGDNDVDFYIDTTAELAFAHTYSMIWFLGGSNVANELLRLFIQRSIMNEDDCFRAIDFVHEDINHGRAKCNGIRVLVACAWSISDKSIPPASILITSESESEQNPWAYVFRTWKRTSTETESDGCIAWADVSRLLLLHFQHKDADEECAHFMRHIFATALHPQLHEHAKHNSKDIAFWFYGLAADFDSDIVCQRLSCLKMFQLLKP